MAIETKKYLDSTGLTYFWGKIKDHVKDYAYSKSEVYTKTEADAMAEGKASAAASAAVADANDKLTKLIGSDANKSVRDIAGEVVSVVTKDAPEAFDTLKEVAEWIAAHGDNQAADLLADINAISGSVDLDEDYKYTGNYEGKTTVKSDIKAAKDTIEAEVSRATGVEAGLRTDVDSKAAQSDFTALQQEVNTLKNTTTSGLANKVDKIVEGTGLNADGTYTPAITGQTTMKGEISYLNTAIEGLEDGIKNNIVGLTDAEIDTAMGIIIK